MCLDSIRDSVSRHRPLAYKHALFISLNSHFFDLDSWSATKVDFHSSANVFLPRGAVYSCVYSPQSERIIYPTRRAKRYVNDTIHRE